MNQGTDLGDPVEIAKKIEEERLAEELSILNACFKTTTKDEEPTEITQAMGRVLEKYPRIRDQLEKATKQIKKRVKREEKDKTLYKLRQGLIEEIKKLGNSSQDMLDKCISKYTAEKARIEGNAEEYKLFNSSKNKVTDEDLKRDPVLFMPNFLTRGELHILAGKAGAGKSFLSTQLAYSLTTKSPFLGMECAQKQRVAYISFEDSKGRLIKRLRNVGWKDTPDILLYTNLDPLMVVAGGNPKETEIGRELTHSLRENNPDTIIIDTYSQAFLHEDGDNRASQAVGNWLRRELSNKTILIIHHVRKAEEHKNADEITLDAIRGASALVGYSRSAFLLAAVQNEMQLKMLKSNYGAPFPDYKDHLSLEKEIVETDKKQQFKGFRVYANALKKKFGLDEY